MSKEIKVISTESQHPIELEEILSEINGEILFIIPREGSSNNMMNKYNIVYLNKS